MLTVTQLAFCYLSTKVHLECYKNKIVSETVIWLHTLQCHSAHSYFSPVEAAQDGESWGDLPWGQGPRLLLYSSLPSSACTFQPYVQEDCSALANLSVSCHPEEGIREDNMLLFFKGVAPVSAMHFNLITNQS